MKIGLKAAVEGSTARAAGKVKAPPEGIGLDSEGASTARRGAAGPAPESERRQEIPIELTHLNRLLTAGQLLASIAHEVRQPLAAIATNAETCARMLAGDVPNGEGAREAARRIARDARRASDMIANLCGLFSKREAPSNSVNLNEVISEIAKLSWPELDKNRIHFQSELATNLKPAFGNRTQLQQVILNLIANACDALRGVDDRPRQLVIKTSNSGSAAVNVVVRDSGPGIDSAYVERIFEPFYSTKASGLGIGLPICRMIVEAHGGELWATPGTPHGAVFQLLLPTRKD